MITQKYIEAVTRFRDAAPWNYINESHLFGIQRKDNDVIDWIITMGSMGDHFALGIYLGQDGLASFIKMREFASEPFGIADQKNITVEQVMLQVFFDEKQHADKDDLAFYKANNVKFAKKPNQYFIGKNYENGYYPWKLDESEMEMITEYINIALPIYDLIKAGQLQTRDKENNVLVVQQGLDFSDIKKKYILAEAFIGENPLNPNIFLTNRIKSTLKQNDSSLMMSLFAMTDGPITEKKGQRPYFPYMMVAIDPHQGMILGFEIFKVEELDEKVQNFLLHSILEQKVLPKNLITNSKLLAEKISDIMEELDVTLYYDSEEELLEEMIHELGGMMGMGK